MDPMARRVATAAASLQRRARCNPLLYGIGCNLRPHLNDGGPGGHAKTKRVIRAAEVVECAMHASLP